MTNFSLHAAMSRDSAEYVWFVLLTVPLVSPISFMSLRSENQLSFLINKQKAVVEVVASEQHRFDSHMINNFTEH